MLNDQDSTSLGQLKELASDVVELIDKSSDTLKPDQEVHVKWTVTKFGYDDNGPGAFSSSAANIVKDSWWRALDSLTEDFSRTSQYKRVLETFQGLYGQTADEALPKYLRQIALHYLQNKSLNEDVVNDLSRRLLRGLKKQDETYGAHVRLEGIVLRSDTIQVNQSISLKKPTKEDLEDEYPYYSFVPMRYRDFGHTPSAFLNVEFKGTRSNETQQRVEKAIVILRLFRVGSVRYSSYQIYTDSLLDQMAGGTFYPGEGQAAFEKYLVTDEDIERLKTFWTSIEDSIPRHLYWPTGEREDYVTIAYKHYSDALLRGGVIEQRIASAVMGLESLFLKTGGEVQELSYRLSNRVAKLLGNFGSDPFEGKEIVKDAYRVRSLFAHGGQLSYNENKRLEKHYGDTKNLLLSILNFLRISIIIHLTIRTVKDSFIDSIDDAFLDAKRNEQLCGILNDARYTLG